MPPYNLYTTEIYPGQIHNVYTCHTTQQNIAFYNTYITDSPANIDVATTFDRGNTENYNSIDVTKYSLSSLAKCHNWSKVIINLELDYEIFSEEDWSSLKSHIKSEFKVDVILSNKRIVKQNDWMNIYEQFDDDLIFYLGNNDHIWIDSNTECLNKLITTGYDLLNLNTFFTSGPEESRAWTIKKNTEAQKAAGVIHSDFEKNFIRAEVVSYDDFERYESFEKAKENGKLRVEGKNYFVKDGDVLFFRVNP